MDLITFLIDFILHIDTHLSALVLEYGAYIYAILFLIVFCETGLVVTPFLPGDSLLFVVGALAATGAMDITTATLTLAAAAIIGDNVNYWIGRQIGQRVFNWKNSRFFNRDSFNKAHAFFEKHGAKALVMARFVAIFRTFMPFTAGVAAMTYQRFLLVDILGGLLWVVSLTQLGYWFGNIPVIKENLEIVLLAIIVISLIPAALALLQRWRKAPAQS
jgi:membrane-associated protein